ncbi:PilZ domain-containing protein [Dokdonella sp.]|uniref:PilZ domain-containing protein n=1 Tax=Dokdonella sp. TaxID=2291710 RepID=UPI0031C9045E|nr:PilZ domain-containing protein [Dokdonella sp.]
MSSEQRRSPRKRPPSPMQVTDALTGAMVGRIGDLSLDGLLLIAQSPIQSDALYQLVFHLPDPSGRSQAIEVGVHEAWSESTSTQGHPWVGFRIIDIAPEARQRLAQWLAGAEAGARR